MYLRYATSSSPKQWVKWLPLAELWYNSSYHYVLKCSPFKALYGTYPSIVKVLDSVVSNNDEVTDTLCERQDFIALLKDHLARAQNKMKAYADTKHSDHQFQIGEQVLLKLQPYAQSSVVNRPWPKLPLKYFSPYQVMEKIGTTTYKLQLPLNLQVHLVFLVPHMKSFTPNYTSVFSELPSTPQLDLHDIEPALILEHRFTKKENSAVT
jgi:hypothetical protein